MTNNSQLTAKQRRAAETERDARPWKGPKRPYDLVKEFVIALGVLALLTVGLAAVFSSPDKPAITVAQWAREAPNDFVTTAVSELDGTSTSAGYGAPYTNDPNAGQQLGPLPLQRLGGVREPVDSAQDFVLGPLSTVTGDPQLTAALTTYNKATADQQASWSNAYADALNNAPDNDPAKVAAGDYGPVPVLATKLLDLARSGGLDGYLLSSDGFYRTDYTKPLLFLSDSGYLEDQARAEHLGGDQWGMMNETGRYPGQAWLWLYTFWYQVPPFNSSSNADAQIWALMMVLSLVLVAVPFIPGLRSLPRLTRVYRLIWREHYRSRREPAARSGPDV
jgi:hypothetical protein